MLVFSWRCDLSQRTFFSKLPSLPQHGTHVPDLFSLTSLPTEALNCESLIIGAQGSFADSLCVCCYAVPVSCQTWNNSYFKCPEMVIMEFEQHWCCSDFWTTWETARGSLMRLGWWMWLRCGQPELPEMKLPAPFQEGWWGGGPWKSLSRNRSL